MQQIGRYEVRGLLGTGAFATVYRAYDPRLNSEVAIKVLAENWAADPDVRRRFTQEARLMRRLERTRLVQVHDLGDLADGRPYFVMRLAEHGTLEDRLLALREADEALTLVDIQRLVRELASCVGPMHAKNVVHRDLKPSNLLIEVHHEAESETPTRLLAPHERLVLGDFGLARDDTKGSAMTILGGSNGYASPEQFSAGNRPSPRSDLYGATAIVYRTICGHPPPHPGSALSAALPGLQDHGSLDAVIQRGLALRPETRHVDAAEWLSELTNALSSSAQPPSPRQPTAAPPTTAAEPSGSGAINTPVRNRRGRALIAMIAIVVLAAGATLGAFLLTRPTGPAILGPSTIRAGEPSRYTSELPANSDQWVVDGELQTTGTEVEVVPVFPGELALRLESVDGSSTQSITVLAALGGPQIIGPDVIAVGSTATFAIDTPNAESIEWVDPSGVVEGPTYRLEPVAPGSFTFSVSILRDDGLRVGDVKQIDIVRGASG